MENVKQFASKTGDYYPRLESEKYAIYDQFGHMIEGNFNSREEAVDAINPDWINTIGAVWVNVHVNP